MRDDVRLGDGSYRPGGAWRGWPVVEGLSGEQVHALADLFSDERPARSVLEQAGFPASRFPWGASNAVLFWWSVADRGTHPRRWRDQARARDRCCGRSSADSARRRGQEDWRS
ncbi:MULTISPECIES: effector-associated domain EAD1-containing protein [Parafrankia]|uniref:effector-associated domain EAD1-containing protein n=1 Tax=Parafrankia TaxID=2994362 RepID=UPI001D008CAA